MAAIGNQGSAMGRNLIVGIFVLTVFSVVCAQQESARSYSADGKTIHYNLAVINPPVAIQPDPTRLNQQSAVNCTLLFMSKLQHGDVNGAAAVTNDPESVIRNYGAYKTRVGDAVFLKKCSHIFDDDEHAGDRYIFELRIGSEHALISEKHLGAAQMLIEKQGKFWMDRSDLEHQSVEFRNLFVLVNDQAAGKLQFK